MCSQTEANICIAEGTRRSGTRSSPGVGFVSLIARAIGSASRVRASDLIMLRPTMLLSYGVGKQASDCFPDPSDVSLMGLAKTGVTLIGFLLLSLRRAWNPLGFLEPHTLKTPNYLSTKNHEPPCTGHPFEYIRSRASSDRLPLQTGPLIIHTHCD